MARISPGAKPRRQWGAYKSPSRPKRQSDHVAPKSAEASPKIRSLTSCKTECGTRERPRFHRIAVVRST
ncbi:MAG: hypothetical protein ACT4PS_08760 [Betaproteobacteria bacterium]